MEALLPRLRSRGAGLVAVSQAAPAVLAAHLEQQPRPFPFVCDPSRRVYQMMGLERGGWAMFLRPRVLGRYLRLLGAGWRPRVGSGEDLFQLGGDFVLDADRRLLLAHRSADPADRPSADTVLAALSPP